MAGMTRRSLINRSIGLVAAGALARPYIANAQAKTATVWWVQGFVQDEDISFKKTIADYEKASGNKLDYSIIPFAPLRTKNVSAIGEWTPLRRPAAKYHSLSRLIGPPKPPLNS